MEQHIPFVYKPDPVAIATEVEGLRKKFEEETAQADAALQAGQRQKAALRYFGALESLTEIAALTQTDADALAEAECSWNLTSFRDTDIEEVTGWNFTYRAGGIWRDFFERTRLPLYREKAAMAGEFSPDTIDYSVDENYFTRRIPELAEMTIVLENYDILENDDGEIMVAIHDLPKGDEKQAILFCDGGEHAILFKGPYRLIICDFVHPEARKKLTKREEVLCYEDQNPDEEKGEYLARVVNRPRTSELAKKLLHRLKKI